MRIFIYVDFYKLWVQLASGAGEPKTGSNMTCHILESLFRRDPRMNGTVWRADCDGQWISSLVVDRYSPTSIEQWDCIYGITYVCSCIG